ncbi:MAG: hypothetical protein HC876_23375 [Chloroflexaceae bacterium]|nr:hypothetical protein [Chloroflexaceae bacterium]
MALASGASTRLTTSSPRSRAFAGGVLGAVRPVLQAENQERRGLGEWHFVIRHMVFLGPALAVMLAVSLMTPRDIRRLAILLLLAGVVGVALIAAVLWLFGPLLAFLEDDIIRAALEQARTARLHILKSMLLTLNRPRRFAGQQRCLRHASSSCCCNTRRCTQLCSGSGNNCTFAARRPIRS